MDVQSPLARKSQEQKRSEAAATALALKRLLLEFSTSGNGDCWESILATLGSQFQMPVRLIGNIDSEDR